MKAIRFILFSYCYWILDIRTPNMRNGQYKYPWSGDTCSMCNISTDTQGLLFLQCLVTCVIILPHQFALTSIVDKLRGHHSSLLIYYQTMALWTAHRSWQSVLKSIQESLILTQNTRCPFLLHNAADLIFLLRDFEDKKSIFASGLSHLHPQQEYSLVS